MLADTDCGRRPAMVDQATEPDSAATTPLQRRAIEIDVAEAFLTVLQERLGEDQARVLFQEAVDRLAASAADGLRERYPDPTLADLWEVWQFLGGDDRLDLHLDELTTQRLRFHVDRCAYADLYRSRGQEEIGVAFSCRRDAPFAKALIPAVHVEQSTTILEGSPRCEFTYTLEDA
jgi:predicted ArsR family transcriptional regulator